MSSWLACQTLSLVCGYIGVTQVGTYEGKVYKKIGFVPKLRSNELRALEDLSVGEKGQLCASRCILRHTIKDPGGVQSCQDSALQMS